MLASKSQVATVRTREQEVPEESSYLEMELRISMEFFIRTHMEVGVVAKQDQHRQQAAHSSQKITAALEQQARHTGMPKMSFSSITTGITPQSPLFFMPNIEALINSPMS